MNLSIRDLELFLTLAEVRNFTQAAARCHLAQSSFSSRIAAIETSLGARLFDRTTRSVELTHAGTLLQASAGRLHADFSDLLEDFRDHATRRKGRVALAVLPSVASTWLPTVLARYRQAWPGIQFTLRDTVSDACIDMVRNGIVDFAIASQPAPGEDMEADLLWVDSYLLVCQADHALVGRNRVAIADLAPYPFIQLSRTSSVRQHLDRALHPCTLNTILEVDNLATVAGLVHAGLGITLLPELTLFLFKGSGLALLPIQAEGLSRELFLVRRRGKSLSFAAAALHELLLRERDGLRRQVDASRPIERAHNRAFGA
jgi:DNA-binding transcriptional LysR family regulator